MDHFITYLTGLLLGEKGEKNIQDITENFLDAKDQSSLNRFITRPHWDVRILNAMRIQENLHEPDGGILSLDDTLIEKTGKMMDGVGYLYDPSQKRKVLCHDVVSTFYRTNTVNFLCTLNRM
ncbi:MAG: transposase [Candidatus Thermoplasmatota archaeon]